MSRRWTKTVYQFFVAGLTVPVFVMITLYMFMRDLELLDSYASVILAEAAISLPFAVLFFTSFLRSVPVELEEAAVIDGAGPLRTYWHVILPVPRPATATLVITRTLAIWNDLAIPLVLLTSDSKQTNGTSSPVSPPGSARGEACPERPGNASAYGAAPVGVCAARVVGASTLSRGRDVDVDSALAVQAVGVDGDGSAAAGGEGDRQLTPARLARPGAGAVADSKVGVRAR
ncbi:carbohydrate ABC transporter permease [Streptomyces sp. NPDC058086]|uniref:carbohydrate ABC transporter permease n=1 Tax=Streptomyces sp. NPDC058086 TaxID=3346334 RepID=UPI0036F0400C